MSIRVAGGYYQRNSNVPPRGAFTVCGWAKFITATPAGFQSIASIEDGTGSAANGTYIGIMTGQGLIVFDAGGQENFPDVGDYLSGWFFWALVGTGTAVQAYARLEGEASLSVLTGLSQAAFTSSAIFVGSDSYHEDFNGELRYPRCWDVELSAVELMAESVSATHIKTASINGAYPFDDTTTDEVDVSGNARNWTVINTPTNGASEPTIGVSAGVAPLDWIPEADPIPNQRTGVVASGTMGIRP